MPNSNILIVENPQGAWASFLKKYFNDTPTPLHICHKTSEALSFFDEGQPKAFFLDPDFLNLTLAQKIKVRRQTDPEFRIYKLGGRTEEKRDFPWDGVFTGAPSLAVFEKHYMETWSMPEKIHMLIVDDEEEISSLIRDYFEGRTNPAFVIRSAENGREALGMIQKQTPDVIILDIKMPVMDGREFYCQLIKKNPKIPVIIFFDSISGEELLEIRKCGNPAVVEKGYQGSSLPALMTLVKKLVYFKC